MFFLDYDVCAQFCQHGRASRTQDKVATSPPVNVWTGDHQGIYPQLAKSQIACKCDRNSFPLPLQKSYSRSGNVSMFIYKVTLLSGVHSSALSHIGQEMEVDV